MNAPAGEGSIHWTELQSDDVDATLSRVANSGGQAVTEASDYLGVGRMAIARDPAGAVFGVIAPANV